MVDFDLGEQFDAVTCLFSSIGYTRTLCALRCAVACMARHLGAGGVLVVEPCFGPEQWEDGHLSVTVVDAAPGTDADRASKVVRMMRARREGDISVLDTHYLVAPAGGISHLTERHELGLFRLEDYADAFEAVGLVATTENDGLTGRVLVLGIRR
jgi:SAM-dependent methyltransferase